MKTLRRRIASLERLQELRIERVAERKAAMDALVEDKQREIENLKAALEGRRGLLKAAG